MPGGPEPGLREGLSPLFWPVRRRPGSILVLDERALPGRERWLEVRSLGAALEVVRAMRTRAFGQLLVFLETLRMLEPAEAERALELFPRARPTFPFAEVGEALRPHVRSGRHREAIEAMLEEVWRGRWARAERLAGLLRGRVLTHCNVSGELALAARLCPHTVEFYATETRPWLQGHLTAWELARQGTPVTLVPDAMADRALACCDMVVVGSDRTTAGGDVVNKAGTYQIALCARARGVPLWALSQGLRGGLPPLEVRPEQELLFWDGRPLFPPGARGLYPAFDVTPCWLVQGLVLLGGEVVRPPGPSAARSRSPEGDWLLVWGTPRGAEALRGRRVLLPEGWPFPEEAAALARRLLELGCEVTVIPESALGWCFARGMVAEVWCFEEEGRTRAGVGIVRSLCREHGVAMRLLEGRRPQGGRALVEPPPGVRRWAEVEEGI